MKNILTIMKKELTRVFKDKRLLFAILMPGILIYLMYSFMGNAFTTADDEARDATYNIVAINMPAEVKEFFDAVELNANYTELTTTPEEHFEALKSGEIDLVIMFSSDFIAGVENGEKPDLSVYYNPSESRSNYAYAKVESGLAAFKGSVVDNEVFKSQINTIYNEKSAAAKGFAMLIPFLIITFLFSGSMAVAPDAIAGEKERGTIATILITPIKRSQLALGKVIALGILALMSALSSFIGLMLSLPKLMGSEVNIGDIFVFGDYALMLLVLVATTLFIVGMLSVISSFAKTVKEATALITPLMILSMLAGLSAMISGTATTNTALYFIPLYNSVQTLISVLTFEVNALNFLVTIASNLIYLSACIFGLTKLFNNENVMFGK